MTWACIFLAVGAKRAEAFAVFKHVRALAWNLHLCHPQPNPSGIVSHRNTYMALYEVYMAKLVARLKRRSGVSTNPVSNETMHELTSTFSGKRNRATNMALADQVHDNYLFPSRSDVEIALSNRPSTFSDVATVKQEKTAEETLEEETHEAVDMTEEQ